MPIKDDEERRRYKREWMRSRRQGSTGSTGSTGAVIPITPTALDAEQSILALCLSVPEAAVSVADLLRPSDMYAPQHQTILAAVCALVAASKPVDLVTVTEELRRRDELETAGGATYLASLLELPASLAALDEYAAMIRQAAAKRRLAQAGRMIAALVADDGDAETMLAQAEALLADVARDAAPAEARLLADVAQERWREMYAHKDDPTPTGLSTGFADLDRLLGGLQAQDLVVLAARPSMGKTALAVQIAAHVAEDTLRPVVVFSAEMSAAGLADRLVCARAGLNSRAVRARALTEDDWQAGLRAADDLGAVPLWVDDSADLTTTSIRARARRLAAKYGGLALVVIDYLQLLQDQVERGASENIRVGRMSRACKQLAKECACPVLLLSQLSRAVEARQNKRPTLADLRDSGTIEQDADVVLFIYRGDYYNPETADKGVAEVIIGKHRNGPIGTVRLLWNAEKVRFLPLARRDA